MDYNEEKVSSFSLDESTIPIVEKLSNGIPGGFFIYHADEEERLIYTNRTLLRFFGCATLEEFKELTGYTFKGMVHPDDIDAVEMSISRQIDEDTYDMDYVEYRIIQKDGTIRWVEDYGHFMRTSDYGDIFCVFIDDATNRLEKRLSDLEEINSELSRAYVREAQFKRAMFRDAVSITEVDVTLDSFVLSSDYQALHGADAGMNYPEKLSDYIADRSKSVAEADRARYREFFDLERLKRCYARGELEQVFENCLTDKFGQEHMFRHTMLLSENPGSGNIMGTCITKDITATAEHKRLLEAAWRQADMANAARNAFLNSISHEIRTPLNAIMGYTELMERGMAEDDPMREYLSKVRSFSEQLYGICSNSLAITGAASRAVVMREDKLHLLDVLEELRHRAAAHAKEKGIDFIFNTDNLKHLYVISDHVQLREILWQILDNAVKYTPEGGRVEFIADEVTCTADGCACYQFEIADNGIGMDEDFVRRIFRPFERAASTTQTGVYGAGLGLPMAKNLIELMGGTISVDSAPGVGSRFTVRLTLRLQPEHFQQQLHCDDRASLIGRRILLVEDNEINQEIALALLRDAGFTVDCAPDGAAAVDMVRRMPVFDLILMDLQMPVMNGYDAAMAIRALPDRARAKTPIIALSADSFAESQERCLSCGMNAHCSKPLDIDKLCAMISAVLSDADTAR